MVGSRKSIEVAMDWTDFDADNQTTIMLSLLTAKGGQRCRWLPKSGSMWWNRVGAVTLGPDQTSTIDQPCR